MEWNGNSYCHFTFLKENKETMDAIGMLAGAMRYEFILRSSFQEYLKSRLDSLAQKINVESQCKEFLFTKRQKLKS